MAIVSIIVLIVVGFVHSIFYGVGLRRIQVLDSCCLEFNIKQKFNETICWSSLHVPHEKKNVSSAMKCSDSKTKHQKTTNYFPITISQFITVYILLEILCTVVYWNFTWANQRRFWDRGFYIFIKLIKFQRRKTVLKSWSTVIEYLARYCPQPSCVPGCITRSSCPSFMAPSAASLPAPINLLHSHYHPNQHVWTHWFPSVRSSTLSES
jgi:hypothetical protein